MIPKPGASSTSSATGDLEAVDEPAGQLDATGTEHRLPGPGDAAGKPASQGIGGRTVQAKGATNT